MTPPHSTDAAPNRTDPYRWSHDHIARAFDHFSDPDHAISQRQYAQHHHIPRATLGHWLRQPDPEGLDPHLVAFGRSPCGQHFLRRVVLALFLVFAFRAACGLRLLGLFLRLTGLHHFVASSHGALHQLGLVIQDGLGAFADAERQRLAPGMPAKDIALVPDETFHAGHTCLVALEPASNFILVEQYSTSRDAATWTTAIATALEGLPVQVLLVSSDQAKGLIACAHNGLQAQHLPELFHGQRDLCRPLAGPLQRQKESAEKQLQQAQELAQYWQQQKAQADAAPKPGRQLDYGWRIDLTAGLAQDCAQGVQACAARQEQTRDAVRGLADDYHPFDGGTGQPVCAKQMTGRLGRRLQQLEGVMREAELGGPAQDALGKGKRWVQALVAALAWFWSVARRRVDELDLPEEAEQVVLQKLLGGLYWRQAARRERTAEAARGKRALAERLVAEAWGPNSPLSGLSAAERQQVERVGREVVGLFCRSSSCVEGRNGRLALNHHGQCRLSAGRLKALTAVHNYLAERADGTTAAERFFGQKPRDAVAWLLERLPDLPRPAAKRPRKGSESTVAAG